jgi:predicted alpha/beta hydrolase
MKSEFQVVCADGYRIGCTHYAVDSIQTKAQIFVGGATGVPQRFYRRFAEHANTRGYAVSTLDYRGVGASAPPSLPGFKMNYLDWGRQDLTAVLNHIVDHSPNLPVFMVGHSYGGHGFGLMPNHRLVKKFYTFASGAGWHGHMPRLERYKIWLLWNCIGPIVVPLMGYMPGKFIGGENLPKDVFYQWRHWCQFPHYFFDDPEMAENLTLFPQVQTPIIAANATDDLWANARSRDHFFKGYCNTSVNAVDLNPQEFNLKSIGHMGYFRKGCEPLWDRVLNWFDEP